MPENPTNDEGRGLMVVVGTDGGEKNKGSVPGDFEKSVDVRNTAQLTLSSFLPQITHFLL